MSDDVKDIKVSLTNTDAKLLVPGMRKRTRKARKEDETVVKEEAPSALKSEEKNVLPMPRSAEIVPASAPAPAPPTVPLTVKIAEKKQSTVPILPSAKILPKKRIIGGVVRKPSLVVNVPPPKQITALADVKRELSGGARKKRKFGSRKISIEMKPLATTRNNRRDLKKKIAAMSKDEVLKELMKTGLITNKIKQLPDEMVRDMLRDFLLLRTAE